MSVLRVVVTGGECTGKSRLAAALAERFGALWVPEAAREAALTKKGPLGPEDVEPIARAHVAASDNALRESRQQGARLLVLDQDLLSTAVYARHYYGSCPAWIEAAALERKADLYLLCHPDVPWVADPARDRPDRREEIHGLFAGALERARARVLDIRGGFDERCRTAAGAIEAALREGD